MLNLNIPSPQEQNLELLVDYCKKTIATFGGDGYDEIVLYFNKAKGIYELHTFQKYEFMKDEEHHIYESSENDYQIIMDKIKEMKLVEHENVNGFGLCGGDYVCKFKFQNRIIRITTANLINESPGIIVSVGDLMRSLIDEKKEIN